MNYSKFVLIFAITIGFLIGTKTVFSQVISEEVKQNIKERVDNEDHPSIVVGIIDSTGKREFFAYGNTDYTTGKKVDENTVFEIGSITKVFTSLLLADMVEKGQLSLEDPVQKYMPSDVKLPIKDGEVIRLKHLATHSSGLPRMPDNIGLDNDNPYKDYGVEEMYAFLKGVKLSSKPGTVFNYSNLGTGLLGHILAKKSGHTYRYLLEENIINVLGLKSTTIDLNEELSNRMAKGHMERNAVSNWDFEVLAPAGAIRSSAVDVLAFLSFQMSLKKTDLAAAIASTQELHFDNTTQTGLAWFFEEGQYIWHNGGTGGFSSFAGFDVKTKKGVVVLTNCTEDVDDIGFHILTGNSPLKKIKQIIDIEESTLEAYVGKYQLAPGMVFGITKSGNQLKAQLTGQSNFNVYPSSENRFFYKVVEAELEFIKNKDGKVEKLILYQNGMEMPSMKIE